MFGVTMLEVERIVSDRHKFMTVFW